MASLHACTQQKGWQQSVRGKNDDKQDKPHNLPCELMVHQQILTNPTL